MESSGGQIRYVLVLGKVRGYFEDAAGAFTSSQNLPRSIFPPLTTHTIFPFPALPLNPAATAHAAAPSQIIWFRAATIAIAVRVSSSVATIEPASNRLA